jgi:hypothetical protein
MIALRVVDANDRWAATWARVGAQQRADRQTKTATRRAARRKPPPRETFVQDGKPTATHPWRTFRLKGSPRFDTRI